MIEKEIKIMRLEQAITLGRDRLEFINKLSGLTKEEIEAERVKYAKGGVDSVKELNELKKQKER